MAVLGFSVICLKRREREISISGGVSYGRARLSRAGGAALLFQLGQGWSLTSSRDAREVPGEVPLVLRGVCVHYPQCLPQSPSLSSSPSLLLSMPVSPFRPHPIPVSVTVLIPIPVPIFILITVPVCIPFHPCLYCRSHPCPYPHSHPYPYPHLHP